MTYAALRGNKAAPGRRTPRTRPLMRGQKQSCDDRSLERARCTRLSNRYLSLHAERVAAQSVLRIHPPRIETVKWMTPDSHRSAPTRRGLNRCSNQQLLNAVCTHTTRVVPKV